MPLFLSVCLGLSALGTGARLLPLSITLLVAAIGIPRFFPEVSPRLVVRVGLFALLAGTVVLLAALDADSGPEVVFAPMLLIGLGIGAFASQLGSVTVSAVPDEESPEVGGVQNTMTNLGASMGAALAGSIMIAAVSTSFLANIQQNPAIPPEAKSQAQIELAGGVAFVSDADLDAALDEANVTPATTDEALEAYGDASTGFARHLRSLPRSRWSPCSLPSASPPFSPDLRRMPDLPSRTAPSRGRRGSRPS